MYLVGFDVGGTFIDLFAFDSETGEFTVRKVDSSRAELGAAIEGGVRLLLEDAGIEPAAIARIAHGTTVVTNQIVERRGARVGLVTTSGFRDVLEIGRMRRSSLTDLGDDRPPSLVERPLRAEVAERVAADGTVDEAVDPTAARAVVERLVDAGAQSIAVCTINSYAAVANERVVEEVCADLGLPCSVSSQVAPEFGEYERSTTTALNSYVMPRTHEYLEDVSGRLGALGAKVPLEIMQSSGGTVPAPVAGRFPVRLIESGPGAGVAAAAQIARDAGHRKIITLDMGGTSADVSVVVDGTPRFVSEHLIDGVPVRTIGIDVRSVGAGGGSIASLDRMGALQVGPESAGAVPGPACYARGGVDPTVTDADLVLGYLDQERFLAGDKSLEIEAARNALARLATPLGTSVEEVAVGIVRLAVTRMAGAIRTITTQAGHDPRDCTLVGFGGAGPTHAALVARELDIPVVLIPSEPALLSARGLLMADYRTDAYRTYARRLAEADTADLSAALADLGEEARAQLSDAVIAKEELEIVYTLELCYEGQQDLVPIPLERLPRDEADLRDAGRRLDEHFEHHYAFLPPGRVPKILRIRATALGVLPRPPVDVSRRAADADAGRSRRAAVVGDELAFAEVPGVRRDAIAGSVHGPAVVEEDYCSTLVLEGQTAADDGRGNLCLVGDGSGEVAP